MKMNSEPAYVVDDHTPTINRVAVSIGNVAHMLRIIAQSTYSDPPGAVVRENIANAIDGHTRAGQTCPIRISNASALDPNLRIRDFGTGMSEEFFLTRYTVTGDSDKGETNDEIGGFGMGRFANFAYAGCDQYYVKSFQNHKWFLGSVTRDADFNVFVQIENRGDTVEPDGVEIIVPIRKADFSVFEERVQTYTEFLVPQPTGLLEREPKKVLLAGDGWRIISLDYKRDGKRVIMGGIPYKLDTDKVFVPSWQTEGAHDPLNQVYSLEFDFPIGSLSVAASREELRYDERTIKAIQVAFQKAFDEIKARSVGMESNYATDWERWNSKEIRTIRKIMGESSHENLESALFHPIIFQNLKKVREFSGRSSVVIDRATLGPEHKFFFFLADVPKWRAAYRRRINEIAATEQSGFAVVVHTEAQLVKAGSPPFTRISTLPVPPKTPRVKCLDPVVHAPREMYTRKNDCWRHRPDSLDLSTPKIYYPFAISKPEKEFEARFSYFQFPDRDEVIGLPKADIAAAEAAGWVSFVEAFKSRISPEIIEAYSIYRTSTLMNQHAVQQALKLAGGGFDPNSRVFKLLRKVAKFNGSKLNWFAFMTLIDFPVKRGKAYEFDCHWNAYLKKHPVLKLLLQHDRFEIGTGYWNWKLPQALKLATKAL